MIVEVDDAVVPVVSVVAVVKVVEVALVVVVAVVVVDGGDVVVLSSDWISSCTEKAIFL